jgi:ribosomal protein S11
MQKKNLNLKKKKLIKKLRIKKKLNQLFNKKPFFFNRNSSFLQKNLNKKYFFRLVIKLKTNNIFCSLVNTNLKKTLKVVSSGIYKIKTSKKSLKFSTKNILNIFLVTVKKKYKLFNKKLIINLTAPIRIRKKIIKQLAKSFKTNSLIINVAEKKCFNGCRPSKKKRKKKKGFCIFK